ncbi:MAG: hypothetical protein AAF682_15775 [Planctomycetota bacterium]
MLTLAARVRRLLVVLLVLLASAPLSHAQDCCCFFDDVDGDFDIDCSNVANEAACKAKGSVDIFFADQTCIAFGGGGTQNDACRDKSGSGTQQCFDPGGGGDIFCKMISGVPTVGGWGGLVLALGLLAAGVAVLRRRPMSPATP